MDSKYAARADNSHRLEKIGGQLDIIGDKLVVDVVWPNLVNQGLVCAVHCIDEDFQLLFVCVWKHLVPPINEFKREAQNFCH